MENIATSADVMAIINIKDIRIILSIILVRKIYNKNLISEDNMIKGSASRKG